MDKKMGSAFTEYEKNIIKDQLKASARECMTKYGIKKTTVDQLTQMSNISKGAFYKFYDSKELLFFEIIEDFHQEFYELALNILQGRTDLSERERIEKAIWESYMLIQTAPFISNMQSELSYLLRKLPEDALKNHYHTGNISIQDVIKESGITLSVSPEFVYTAIHAIEVLLTHTDDIGKPYFDEVLKLFIKSISEKIV
ncbi:MAG: TetR family transcriptional regulator [Clostridia bacterium]|jgi:AcrR family transcriptional regulator|nr:TetR family transcriptional regulator [Clostridia bacterium]